MAMDPAKRERMIKVIKASDSSMRQDTLAERFGVSRALISRMVKEHAPHLSGRKRA